MLYYYASSSLLLILLLLLLLVLCKYKIKYKTTNYFENIEMFHLLIIIFTAENPKHIDTIPIEVIQKENHQSDQSY
mgnify:CR=1 FL=1